MLNWKLLAPKEYDLIRHTLRLDSFSAPCQTNSTIDLIDGTFKESSVQQKNATIWTMSNYTIATSIPLSGLALTKSKFLGWCISFVG